MQPEMAFLRVKIKSLAEEARIIRHEERRWPTKAQRKRLRRVTAAGVSQGAAASSIGIALPNDTKHYIPASRDNPTYHQLHVHRTVTVRNEARAAQLAMAFLHNRRYRAAEAWIREAPPLDRVVYHVRKFGPVDMNTANDASVQYLVSAWMAVE